MDAVEAWLCDEEQYLQENALAEADQKAQSANQRVIMRSRLINPELYIELRHLLADSQIQASFDDNLVRFANKLADDDPHDPHVKANPLSTGLKAFMATAEFMSKKTTGEQATALRAWFDQEHAEWQKITLIRLWGG